MDKKMDGSKNGWIKKVDGSKDGCMKQMNE